MTALFILLFSSFLQVLNMEPENRSDPLPLPRIHEPVIMDGRVDEALWEAIDPLPLTTYEPVAGLPPSERTEVRMAYDDNYIYASIRAFDSDPSGIRMNSLYRGHLSGSDLFHILLDTYNDNESAMVFTITPAGVKWDAIISNDAVGSGAVNSDYETYWEVSTHVDELGWYAEVRIPFSSIGFQDIDGRVVMGLTVQRMIARKNERGLFPAVPANISSAFFKSSLAQKVVFEDIYSSNPLHVTPYFSGGVDQENLLNSDQTAFSRSNNHQLDAGLDVKYGVSNNLNLDLTVNTDFAQVEADDQQVNLTRFNLFFPEKRQFFQERSSVFEFNTGGSGRLFHSRRIGLTPAGEQVRILGGGRLTGRIGSWDIGLLNMQTDSFSQNPSENFGVVRLRRRVFNPYSFAGVMGTSRINLDGTYNISYGTDGSLRLTGDDYFTWAWAQSLEEETRDQPLLANSRIRFSWERRSREGFAWESTVSRSGETYNPGTGFIDRLNYFRIGQSVEYGWMPGGDSPLLWHAVEMDGAVYWRTTTGKVESIDFGPSWNATTNPGHNINASVTWHYEDIPVDFPLLDRTVIEAGKYQFVRGIAGYEMASSRLFRTRLEADMGTFYGGWRFAANLSPTWNVSRHLEFQASWLYNLVSVPMHENWFSEHVGQLRIRTALNTHLSTNAFIQMNSSADLVSANIRFRYSFRDGNDFWIVLNEGVNIDRQRVDPALPRTDSRTVLVKYTYTFHR